MKLANGILPVNKRESVVQERVEEAVAQSKQTVELSSGFSLPQAMDGAN